MGFLVCGAAFTGLATTKKTVSFPLCPENVPVKTQKFQFLTHFLKTGDQFLYIMPASQEMKLTSGMA
jgi:hypothetical protein